jgi:hypothetical protein
MKRCRALRISSLSLLEKRSNSQAVALGKR